MIGDMILAIKTFLKQLCCIHDYKITNRDTAMHIYTTYTCKKCGRMKVK